MTEPAAAFFAMPQEGHFHTLLPLISGLARQGIAAHVFTDRRFQAHVERAGGTFEDLFARYPIERADGESVPAPCRYVSFAGRYAEDVLRDLEEIRPSLVVYDAHAVIGYVVGAHLGIPYVGVCPAHNASPARLPALMSTLPEIHVSDSCTRAVETLADRYGLDDASPFSFASLLSPFLNLYGEPAAYLTEVERRAFEPVAFHGCLPSLEEMEAMRLSSDRSYFEDGGTELRLYVSFGTVVWRYFPAEALRAVRAIPEPGGSGARGRVGARAHQAERIGRGLRRSMDDPPGGRCLRDAQRAEVDARGDLQPSSDDLVPVLLGPAGARREVPGLRARRPARGVPLGRDHGERGPGCPRSALGRRGNHARKPSGGTRVGAPGDRGQGLGPPTDHGPDLRALFTTLPGSGHLHPLIPLARTLRERGHEVAFATAPRFRAMVEASGFPAFEAGRDWLSWEVAPRPDPLSSLRRFVALGGDMAGDLVAVASRFRPDVLVREQAELGGWIAAALFGVPSVMHGVNVCWTPEFLAAARPEIDDQRARYGLGPDSELAGFYGDVSLDVVPPSFQRQGRAGLPPAHPLRPGLFDRSGPEDLPEWMPDRDDRPLVYATLGTIFNRTRSVFLAILEAIRDEPVELLMTVGRNVDPAELGEQPPHLHVARYVPQSLLLPHASAVISHGGFNTTMAGLRNGLPLCCLPLGADHGVNAVRCAELGVGIAIDPDRLAPGAIRAAVRRLLADGGFRERACAMRAEIEAMPGPDSAAGVIERL
jgi:MGT family glycosyltransferase